MRAGLGLSLVLMVANLGKMLLWAKVALGYPYDLEYGEGIVWQQLRNIMAGTGYGPLGIYPAIVYHYPPVYHLATAALASFAGLDQLYAGRMLSLVSMLAAMALVGQLCWAAMPQEQDRLSRVAAAAVGALCLASMPTILTWSTLMRVDMLACAFTLGGLALAIGGVRHPAAVPFAALAFVLAVYTKQTAIAGPVAAAAGLWCVRPRSAVMLIICCAGLGFAILLALSLMSHGGFLRHILLYNINRLDLGRWHLLVRILLAQAMLIAIAAFGILAAWRRLFPNGMGLQALRQTFANDRSKAALLIVMLFLGVKTAMLPMLLKSGSSENYAIEWLCALAVFVGLAAIPVIEAARGSAVASSRVLRALFLIALPVAAAQIPSQAVDAAAVHLQTERMSQVVARIRAARKPVISDEMVLLIRAGRDVAWEPAIAAELGHSGVYDEAAFANLVRRRAFAFFVTHGDRGTTLFDERYNPVVADAMEAAYPRKEKVGSLVLHLPAL